MIGAIILGLLAGYIAKALMPGKDPGGFFVTILLGSGGVRSSVSSCSRSCSASATTRRSTSAVCVGAIIGTMILLGVYRAVAGGDGRRTADHAVGTTGYAAGHALMSCPP